MDENSTNSTRHHTLLEVLNRPTVAVTSVVLLALILCTLVGNFLVVWTIFTTRRLRFSAFFFVASLAVADFLVGLVVLPISLAYHLTFEMEGKLINNIFSLFFCKEFIPILLYTYSQWTSSRSLYITVKWFSLLELCWPSTNQFLLTRKPSQFIS
jgi:hypothetical protein